ncbi:ATP-dependent helicase [Verrucomicrobium spinosum]|uniref:ATP-dependent helicase n=1 Tax=Verrucomicrobium spinosum TaxID=2736 RepID=UPI0001746B2E|nr:UvrD-helicase domain-containing protein [Verrucomicrobium spinosum]
MARDYTLHGTPAPHRIDYRAELNEQQFAAVTAPAGQSLVIAGAGSGKTRVLTYRVAYLLDNGIAPENILLVTFTNKASREMLDRVQNLLPIETNRLWGGTFHSIGNRLLRKHGDRLGLRQGFSIMDREDQKDLMETVVTSSGVDTTTYRFPKPEVLGEIFSLADNTSTSIAQVVKGKYPYFERVVEGIEKLRELYTAKKLETNNVDFDDLLTMTLRLFRENEDLLDRYRRTFRFILVDEYQDTNLLQSELIELLAGPEGNLMVVGDDAQSIYSWRGANLKNILEFPQRYPKARVYKIEVNYRSVPEVLHLANRAIEVNQGQFRKALMPARVGKEVLPALVPLDNASAQASFVAQRILELRDEGMEFNEMAVIYRAHYHSLEIQMELTNRGIPFQITSGLRFFEQAHVKDVAAFMKFAVNRQDEVSFMRLVRLIPGVGTASAGKMWAHWLQSAAVAGPVTQSVFGECLRKLPAPKKAAKIWEQTAFTLEELLESEGEPVAPSAMIRSVMEGVYEDYMRTKFKNADQRKQDLEQLSNYSTRFKDVSEFLSQLALVSGVDTDEQPNANNRDSEAVTLTTAHQAKGLEWQAVFAVWLAEGMFPNNRVIEESGEVGLEEERRLFYVTVTRAKDELYLTYPVINYQARDGEVLQRPSRFLQELPKDLMETWNVRSVFA